MSGSLRTVFCTATIFIIAVQCLTAGKDELLRYSAGQSLPSPFDGQVDWEQDQPAISTGYYFADSEDPTGERWRPRPELIWRDLEMEPEKWNRIVSGPKQFSADYWNQNPLGHAYFRNPGDLDDSTDNAFAGPISIGFDFYYNGIRYDSFYVSSNGLIALSNRRYHYDQNNRRVIPAGQTTAWDAQSDDTRPRIDNQNTNGLNDQTPDDWGYQFIACGNKPLNKTAGIRQPRNSSLDDDAINDAGLEKNAPIIAPLWDDWQLSQVDGRDASKRDLGQVWFRKIGTELVVKFVQLMPIGPKNHPLEGGTDLNFGADQEIKKNGEGAFTVNFQVTLSGADSSISILYEKANPPVISRNQKPIVSWDIARQNSSVGLRGPARYRDGDNERQTYTQFTEFIRDGEVLSAPNIPARDKLPRDFYAVKFKQYKNLLRVVDVDYLVADPADGIYRIRYEDVSDFELLANNGLRLGTIKPVVTFQNLSNNIQGMAGVNYQEQEIHFRTEVQIENEKLDRLVAKRSVCVDSLALANPNYSGVVLVNAAGEKLPFNGKGVPPYGFVEVTFPALLATGEGDVSLIGRLKLTASATGLNCAKEEQGEDWPFDNSLSYTLHRMLVLKSFYDNVNDYEIDPLNGLIPSSRKWVNFGAQAVDGVASTFSPPPPRGKVVSSSKPEITLDSPVIEMNRIAANGQDLAPGGDELRSVPIDMRGYPSATLSFAYQRTGIPPEGSFDRGGSDRVLVGPEARIIENGEWQATKPLRQPDVLELHFARPSVNLHENIINIPDTGWSRHPVLHEPETIIKDNPAFTVFGGGGVRRGFDFDNPDSALTRNQGLRHSTFDTGRDQEFLKAYVELPSFILDAENDAARFFRFKLAVKAQKHGMEVGPVDDADNFYIDNVTITTPSDWPELEVMSVGVSPIPASGFPASQASELPMYVKISNNSNVSNRAFAVELQIAEQFDPQMRLVYARSLTFPFLRAKRARTFAFPNWNSRTTRPGAYLLCARLRFGGLDENMLNDSTHSTYALDFTDALTYDRPSRIGVNSVPTFTWYTGKGINLRAQSSGSFSNSSAYGAEGGSSPGQIALKFELVRSDTVRGYTAFYGSSNQNLDEVRYAIHADDEDKPATQPFPKSLTIRKRCLPDLDAFGQEVLDPNEPKFNTYGTYLLDEEIILPAGTYWLVATQTIEHGFELGASDYRMQMQTLNYSTTPALGVNGVSRLLDYGLREFNSEAEYVNSTRFLYNNSSSGDDWQNFTPNVGNPAFAHLTHSGQIDLTRTYTRASWAPMLRVYFGFRQYADPPEYLDEFKPVELTEFDGLALPPQGIELFWETAAELDNAGFYVERRPADTQDEFESIEFVDGAGTSTSPLTYSLLDKNVKRGMRYEYRLRQVDYDGSVSFSHSIILTYDYADLLHLTNKPNPFTEQTDIHFSIPNTSHVRLEIIDLLGNSVRTLLDREMPPAVEKTIAWDTRDNTGAELAAGIYVCRLTVGSKTMLRTLNVIK